MELWHAAKLDRVELFDDCGQVKPIHELSPEVRRAIESVEFNKDGGVRKVTFVKKSTALEQIGKSLGMFVEHKKVELGPSEDLKSMLEGIAEERRLVEGGIEGGMEVIDGEGKVEPVVEEEEPDPR